MLIFLKYVKLAVWTYIHMHIWDHNKNSVTFLSRLWRICEPWTEHVTMFRLHIYLCLLFLAVMHDITSTMFNTRFMEELFKPQEIYSKKAMRTVFDRLAHASIMRLNAASMDKVGVAVRVDYDLCSHNPHWRDVNVASCGLPSWLHLQKRESMGPITIFINYFSLQLHIFPITITPCQSQLQHVRYNYTMSIMITPYQLQLQINGSTVHCKREAFFLCTCYE